MGMINSGYNIYVYTTSLFINTNKRELNVVPSPNFTAMKKYVFNFTIQINHVL